MQKKFFGVTPPAELQPPGLPPDAGTASSRRHIWLWAFLVILLLLALVVVFALPSLLGPPQQASTTAKPPPPIVDAGVERDQVQQTLHAYLKLRARMELGNAGVWGEPDWGESAKHASGGDRYFAQRQFAAAGREYRAALEQLQQLEADKSVMLAAALERGMQALAANDVSAAIVGFEAALQIEPKQPDAIRGIAQAQSRGAAIEQMNLGRAAEVNGEDDAALLAYQQAVKLDTEYTDAATAVQRLSADINTREFTQAMTTALNALDAGQTVAAGKALTEAQRLRPADSAVQDARLRLQSMRAQAGLNRLRRKAGGQIRNEDWQGAATIYRKALDIDSSAAFARSGLQRAEERIRLHQQFDHYLDRPARLYAAAPLSNAERLLANAGAAPPEEPGLAGKIARLRQLVTAARTPVKIRLNSDGETNVVIYRVARLGSFESHQLDLRPGDYTVVGSRDGYRDVRQVIRVRPGKPVSPVLIRCEEEI